MTKHNTHIKKNPASVTIYDMIVVGGGASGMMAAGRAGERGLKVLVLEKNKRLGEKLHITGGGRCNVTNFELDNRVLLKKYGKAEPFLYSLFSHFSVKDTALFFESRGLPLVVEAQKRAFPITQKAGDVVSVLEKYLSQGNVTVVCLSPVTKINVDKENIVGVVCTDTQYKAKKYVLATGCMSHPETGSTGDGFLWLEKLGHRVMKPTPTIVPLKVSNPWIKSLAGVTLPAVSIVFYLDGKKQFKVQGNILCTHFGLSGPTILNNAVKVADLLQQGTVTAKVDMYPQMDNAELERTIIDIFDKNKNKTLKNIIKEIAKEGTAKGVTLLLDQKIDTYTKVNLITKEQRKSIVRLLKEMPISVVGLMGFDRAVIADGGVPLEEIDMKTMRSKKIENLFITGDLLHIQRPSGGFSLQLCWSTGYVAGSQ